jgi:uncharacterized protein YjbI with pentapeptide repeats
VDNALDRHLIDSDSLEYLQVFLANHRKWLANKSGGKQADLSKKSLVGMDFTGANLSKAILVGTNLAQATLRGANLSEADMFGAVLSESDLQSADLSGAVLRGASLRGANLTKANLTDADLRGGVMLGNGGESFGNERTDMTQCLMDYAQGTRAKMSNVDFRGSSMVGANLQGAKMFGSDLSEVDLSYANLRGADLSDTRLDNTNLNGSDLNGAQLSNATIKNVSLRAAKMSSDLLSGLDKRELDIGDEPEAVEYRDMSEKVREQLDQHEEWINSNGEKGHRAILDGMDLSYHDLSGRDMTGVRMRGGKLRGARLKSCILVLGRRSKQCRADRGEPNRRQPAAGQPRECRGGRNPDPRQGWFRNWALAANQF